MKPEHYDRLNILMSIEGTFPGLPTGQVLDLARWVENGTQQETRFFKPDRGEIIPNRDVSKIANTVARELRKAGMSSPRKWTNLDAIPSNVGRIMDRNGGHAKRIAFGKELIWVYPGHENPQAALLNTYGPFTEVLDHE